MNKIAVWKPIEYLGMENLFLDEGVSGVYAHSVVLGVENQAAFRLDYILKCGADYGIREAILSVNRPVPHKTIYLTSDGQGNWFDQWKTSWPELDGCIDIDISATPFTNTLPIRRIQWQIGQSEVFKMVYILVPDLTVSVDRQRYTCLEQSAQGATFRYESLDSDFTADVTVDSDGLVLNYPGLFERVI